MPRKETHRVVRLHTALYPRCAIKQACQDFSPYCGGIEYREKYSVVTLRTAGMSCRQRDELAGEFLNHCLILVKQSL